MKVKLFPTFAGAAIFISLAGILSRGLGFIREILFASLFGTSNEFDIYLAGSVLPVIINTSILYLAQNYIVTFYSDQKNENDKKKFFNETFTIFLLGGISLSILLLITSQFIIELQLVNVVKQNKITAKEIFRLMLISIPFNAAFSVIAGFLQAQNRFKRAFGAPLILNLSIILVLILLSGNLNIYAIPVGYVLGSILQFLFIYSSVKHKPVLIFPKFNSKKISCTISILILIEFISQLYIFADRFFIGKIDTGGISALNYAMNIFSLPVSIFAYAISNTAFPEISKTISQNDFSGFRKIFADSFKIILLIFIPVLLSIFFQSEKIISFLFQRGKFDQNSTLLTAEILKIYSISLIFYALYSLFNKIILAQKQFKILLILVSFTMVLKFILNFYLTGIYNVKGLALATSISYVFLSVSAAVVIFAKIRKAKS